ELAAATDVYLPQTVQDALNVIPGDSVICVRI
ncbi:MAG: hypothetical protein ACI83P_001553, partial [Janthinobacterium sp.]